MKAADMTNDPVAIEIMHVCIANVPNNLGAPPHDDVASDPVASEIKHGCIAPLAPMGHHELPGYLFAPDVTNDLAASEIKHSRSDILYSNPPLPQEAL